MEPGTPDERRRSLDEEPLLSQVDLDSTLVVGLGNPLLGDDGIGWRVAEQVQREIECKAYSVEVDYLAVGGLSLMERLVGYERVIVIDAITTGQQPTGSLYCFPLSDLADPTSGHLGSAHDTSLQTALKVGRSLGVHLPEEVTVVAIEADHVYDFTRDLTPAVAAAAPLAAQMVMELLRQPYQEGKSL